MIVARTTTVPLSNDDDDSLEDERSQVEGRNHRWKGPERLQMEGSDHKWRRAIAAGGGERSQVEGSNQRSQTEAIATIASWCGGERSEPSTGIQTGHWRAAVLRSSLSLAGCLSCRHLDFEVQVTRRCLVGCSLKDSVQSQARTSSSLRLQVACWQYSVTEAPWSAEPLDGSNWRSYNESWPSTSTGCTCSWWQLSARFQLDEEGSRSRVHGRSREVRQSAAAARRQEVCWPLWRSGAW